MKEFIPVFLISALILTSGCFEAEKEIVNVYVCPDGSLASNADDCHRVEPEIVEVTMYVCADGEVVSEADECVIATTSLPETSSTTVQETTLEELGTTIAEETSSTVEEETSSTVETTTTSSTTTLAGDDSCAELGCPSGTSFVGSEGSTSKKYHYCDCRYANAINPGNIICFVDEEEAQEQGYSPCSVCEPPT